MKTRISAKIAPWLGISALICAQGTPALASDDSPAKTRIYGGEPVKTCEWPTTLGLGYCTGTLVHPKVVLTAAHCGSPKELYLGENYKGGISKTVTTKYCQKNGRYSEETRAGGDSQYCVLNEAVEDIPIAPIAFGCELEQIKPGADIWLVGFGQNDSAYRASGVKHKVEVKINSIVGNHLELIVGGNGKATCYGDSGGPAYLKMSDGTWRTVGITSYGTSKQCGYPSGLTTASSAVKWIQKSLNERGEDIDLQPCYDDEGKWAPTAKCGGFALEPGKAFGTWEELCSEDAPRSGMSSICGPAAKDGDFPDGKSKLELSWGENMPKSPQISEDQSLELSVAIKGSTKKVDHLAALLDDEVLVQGKLKKKLLVEDLQAGEYEIKVQARDEDDKVLSETKTISLEVTKAEDSVDPNEPSDDDGSNKSNEAEEPSDEVTPSQDKDSKDAKDSAKGDDSGDGDRKGPSCTLGNGSGSPAAFLFGLVFLGWMRRRSQTHRSYAARP